ncbi:MAG: carbon storage regulator CsrA [Candidatus Sedimenticola sp. (ex Thyasira tokunagai)]
MLVLTRKLGEALIFSGDIEVRIIGIDRGQVRIGINAPKEVNVVREELLNNQHQEKRSHAS